MIDLASIHSLSDFQRNTKADLKRLKDTGKPEVLTVNGRAEVVVQSAAAAYQRLVELADRADAAGVLRERWAAADAGVPGIPAEDVLATVRNRLGLTGWDCDIGRLSGDW